MKFITLVLVSLTLFGIQSFSQVVDYNRIILPEDVKNISTEELLVQLAWSNHPANTNLLYLQEISRLEEKSTSLEWIGLFGFTGNLNEFNINELTGNQDDVTGNVFFPRYNFYLNIPFSRFYEIPINKKIGNLRTKIADNNVNNAKLELRNRVLNSYSDYIRAREILKVQKDFEEIANSNFIVAEEEFKQGRISLEEYYTIYQNYQTQRIERIEAENAYRRSINDLEALIGTKLDNVIEN